MQTIDQQADRGNFMNKIIKIFTDGGARGNPGPAGVGVVITNPSNLKPITLSEYIGEATNNQAEYKAVIVALEWVNKNIKDDIQIEFYLDSQLVVEQLNQNYKIKNEGLKPLFWQIRELVLKIGGKVSFQYVPRAENHHADKLVNIAIDKHIKGVK